MFLFQKDFFGLPVSKVTRVGSSEAECSIVLNCVPSAITRSLAASLMFGINPGYPPILDKSRKDPLSLQVRKVKGKQAVSWYFCRRSNVKSQYGRSSHRATLHSMWPWPYPLATGICVAGSPTGSFPFCTFTSGQNYNFNRHFYYVFITLLFHTYKIID